MMLADLLNTDWTKHYRCHDCTGCCQGPVDCKAKVYALLLECDLTMSNSQAAPSMDDWGSFGAFASKVVLGTLMHHMLPRLVTRSFDSWQSLLLGSKDVAVTKKGFRWMCVCKSNVRILEVVLLYFIGTPLENLIK